MTSPIFERAWVWGESEVTELPQILHYAEYLLLEGRGAAAGLPAHCQSVEGLDEVVKSGAGQQIGSVLLG